MNGDRVYSLLDPVTGVVRAECTGPTADGRCPLSDAPPFACAGLRLIPRESGAAHGVSYDVITIQANRCPLAFTVQEFEEV